MTNLLKKIFALDDSEWIQYQVKSSASTVKSLLEAASEREEKFLFYRRFPIKFSDSQFSLTRISNRNSWRRYFVGVLEEKNGQTSLKGRFEVSRVVALFTMLWLIAVTGVSVLFATQGDFKNPLQLLILPILGFALPHVGRALSKPDEKAVIEFLEKSLKGFF